MTAQDHIRENWAAQIPRLTTRFPQINPGKAPSLLKDKDAFVSYLADTHHLTLTEAQEEVDDFLYLEGLISEVAGA